MRGNRLYTTRGGSILPMIDRLESRVQLSATLEYRAQEPDGTLEAPVTVTTGDQVLDFKLEQSSLLQQGATSADFDLFLDLANIEGESRDAAHQDQIELLSFSWGHDAAYAYTDTGLVAGKTQFQELHVTARVSKASPKLLDAMTKGTHLGDAVLYVRKRTDLKGGGDFMQIILKDVMISSYQVTPGNTAGGYLVEEVTLGFVEGEMEYRRVRPDGTLEGAVRFEEVANGVEDYAPSQRSLLQNGSVEAPGQYLFLSGIDGESRDKGHERWIDVRSFRWGGDQQLATATGGSRTGKTEFHELHVTATVSKASPELMDSMATGKHIATAILAVENPTLTGDFYKLKLDGAVVSSYQLTTNADGELVEEFTLAYQDVNLEYRPRKLDGTLDAAVPFQAAQQVVQGVAPPQASVLGNGGDVDAFLELPGIPGESRDKAHANEIEISAFAWGGDLLYSPLGSGKAGFHELRLSAPLSKASPLLVDRLVKGAHLQEAVLVVRRGGRTPVEYFKVRLQDVIVSSHKVTTAVSGLPVEEVSLTFGAVEVEYRPQKPDGSLDAAVTFAHAGAAVADYAATQRPLLLDGYAVNGAIDTFLRLDGILGESNDADHRDQIDVHAFEWGADALLGLTGSGIPIGKATLHELHVVSPVSRASPQLMAAMTTGKFIATGDLHVRRAGDKPQNFFKVSLKNVVVSSYQLKPGLDGRLMEEYTLGFADVRIDYSAENPDGTLQNPVTFQTAGQEVADFRPPQVALIDRGIDALATADAVLSLPGISGESRLSGHEGEIDVLSFGWGGDAVRDQLSGAGKAEMRELHVVARVSKASPKIIDAMRRGTHVPEAELFLVKAEMKGAEFMQVRLEDVLVSSYKTTTANDGTLLEEFTLAFDRAEWDYRRLRPDGTLDAAVRFAEQGLAVDDFAPTQGAILGGAHLSQPLRGFVAIGGIPGESLDPVHRDEIDVLSFAWGGDAIFGSSGGGTRGGVTRFHEVHLVTRTSRATPRLLDHLDRGKLIPDAALVLRKDGTHKGSQAFFAVRLADVIVSSYRVTTAADGSLLEEITLAYGPGGTPPQPPSPVTLTGTAGGDTFYLRRSATGGIDVFTNATGSGTPVQVIPSGADVTIETLAGDDLVVLDQVGGDVVVPGGIVLRGGDGADTLRFLNATGNATINQLGITTVGGTSVGHGVIEDLELAGILIGLLLPANQTLTVAGTDGLLSVQDLDLDAGARLDLGTNDLKVLNASAASLEGLLKTARDGATRWHGPGIGTSAATALTGLAPVQQGADALVKFTYNGDANGDGRVNADDYFRIDQGFLSQPASAAYAQGDFNFDDRVNADDYFLIDQAFLGQGTPLESGSVPVAAATTSAAGRQGTASTGVRRDLFSDRRIARRARSALAR